MRLLILDTNLCKIHFYTLEVQYRINFTPFLIYIFTCPLSNTTFLLKNTHILTQSLYKLLTSMPPIVQSETRLVRKLLSTKFTEVFLFTSVSWLMI